MQTLELEFIDDVLGIETKLGEFEERENQKRAALDEAFNSLKDERESIRQGMKVQLVDSKGKKHEKSFSKKGQEHALDTFVATRKGRGLSKEDMQKASEAMSKIVKAARLVLGKKNKDGTLLFDSPEELAQELFTPLVREGILPENFVIDDYSEVQQLLNETFQAYKQTNEEARKAKEQNQAGETANRYGAGDGLDKFGAVMKRLAGTPERMMDKVGLDKDKRRIAGIFIAGGKASFDIVMAGLTVDKWQLDPDSGKPRIEASFEKQLDPSLAGYTDTDPDIARTKYAQDFRASKIEKLGLPAQDTQNIINLLNVQEHSAFVGTKEGVTGYGGVIADVITKLALPGDKAKKLTDLLDTAHHELANVQAAQQAAKAIDQRLVALLDQKVRKGVGKALAGAYAGAVDAEAVGAAAAKTKPDDQEMIAEFAVAFEKVLARGVDPSLSAEAKALAKEFVANAQGSALQKALQKDPATAFEPLVAAADKAINKVLSNLDPAKKNTIDARIVSGALAAVARLIDARLSDGLKSHANANAAEAFAGLYASEVDLADAAAAATKDPPDGDGVIGALADAFHAAFAKASPNPSDKTFVAAGKSLAKELRAQADAGQLATDLGADLGAAFVPVIKAAEAAIDAALKKSKALVKQLASNDTVRAIASKAAFPDDGESAMNELEESEQELKEYERQLVLIDEGGISAAELRTIEKLIEELQRDKLIADMIIAAGNALTSLGTTTTTIVGAATEAVTDTLVGQIVGPLKAAKLIIQFSVAMKKANDRRILFQKFNKSLKLSKKSVSILQSTLQGFVNNKVEQITFRAIEDALTLVQIASAILGSVPEPITLAVSKTMSSIATAAESVHKVSEMIYNEKMLADGWKKTLAAIRNPKERSTGLAALRLNPTLGMHAIAWAGMEKQPPDPIARMLLSDLGINEQTLAVSGTERKVREYLENLLTEDRTFIDPDLVRPQWVPKDVKLTGEDWAVVTTRAWRDAKPQLKKSTEPAVLDAFKRTDQHDLNDLATRADQGQIEEDEMQRVLTEAAHLKTALKDYAPVTSDGSDHEDMASLAATFLKLATEHEAHLRQLAAQSAKAQSRDVQRVTGRLNDQIKALGDAEDSDDFAAIKAAFETACEQLREVQIARMEEDPQIAPLYKQLMTKAQELSQALAAMEVWLDELPDWSGDLADSWTKARKKAGLKGSTGLTSLIKAAQKAVTEHQNKTIQDDALDKALQAVIDNIDQQLPQADPGLALYLRKMKSGAKKLQP